MSKKRKTEYRLEVCYPAKFYPEMDETLERAIGHSDGAGMGFGCRDHTWYFPTLAKATAAWKKIARVRNVEDIRIERVRGE